MKKNLKKTCFILFLYYICTRINQLINFKNQFYENTSKYSRR